jgi:clan AA aspartic protease
MTRITLKNIRDAFKAEEGLIPEPEIRQTTVDVLVDTGATTLIINKKLFQELGLDVMEEQEITFANDEKEICKKTYPVEIHWQDRKVAMSAIVVEESSEILLGVLPLEGMDLVVDPVNQRLIGAHGDRSVYLAKSICKK